jgi:hypothetical protein
MASATSNTTFAGRFFLKESSGVGGGDLRLGAGVFGVVAWNEGALERGWG